MALAATALNRDRYPDLVVLTPGRVTPLLGRGDGTFRRGRPVPVSYSALAVAVGDLNGDRRADVAVAGWDAPIEPSSTGVVNVLLGDGRGGLRRAGTLPVAGRSIAVTDVSGDGRPDLVLAGSAADVRGPGTASILLGNGDGSFSGTLVGADRRQPAALGAGRRPERRRHPGPGRSDRRHRAVRAPRGRRAANFAPRCST